MCVKGIASYIISHHVKDPRDAALDPSTTPPHGVSITDTPFAFANKKRRIPHISRTRHFLILIVDQTNIIYQLRAFAIFGIISDVFIF